MRRSVPILLTALILVLATAPAGVLGAGGPHTLTYIESSQGLTPPTMEGGNTEVEMGDVNDDGFLDLVSIGDHGSPYINTDEHGVMVWFGDGTGTWAVHQYGNFGYGGIALGDVNNDGYVDVGYGMHHNYSGVDLGDQILEVALGDGTGLTWTAWDDGLATNGESWGLFGTDFADVDNDGDLDVGSISFGCCAGVHVYLNNSDGTWQQSFGFLNGNSHMHFVFGDVNGDGDADFAVSHELGTVYLGDGLGGFSLDDGGLPVLPQYAARPGTSLGDVTGDGRDELAFVNANGGPEVWTWTGPGAWQSLSDGLPVSGPYDATQLFDMDVDGYVDLVAFGGGQVRIWGGDGGTTWTEIGSFATPAPGYLAAFRVGGDADHNGYPDIALVAEEGGWPSSYNHFRFFKEASVPTDLSITPVYPHGGETLKAGGIAFVDWLSAIPSGGPGEVAIELSTTGPNGPWQSVADELTNGGRYQWHLPTEVPTTDQAYLRYTLTVEAETRQAVTPAAFQIIGGPAQPTMHVQAIYLHGFPAGERDLVLGLVRILDGESQPVESATVLARWRAAAGTEGLRRAVTNPSGLARYWLVKPTGAEYEFCVLNVGLDGYVYDPDQNLETCDTIGLR